MRIAASLALCVCTAWAAGGPPSVLQVEPPFWWAGHSLNPVRLLMHGRNLSGAQLETQTSSIRIGTTVASSDGDYLFADVWVDPKTAAGSYPFRVQTPGGKTEAPFSVAAPLTPTGRFQGFSSDDVIYLIMPDRFADGDPSNDDPAVSHGLFDRKKPRYYHGGDLQGIIDHLPYLKELGVTVLWLTPLYDNANDLGTGGITDYHGYGAVDFYRVEEHFGNLNKLRELVDSAHQLGLKVIQDEVANHTGPHHPWVKDEPTPTWFNGTESNHSANNWQVWTTADRHATDQLTRATLEGWFANILPDLNQRDPQVARYLIQNTLWWIGAAGFDGVREDTVPYVPRTFWRDWMAAIKRQYPRFKVVGEVWDGDPWLVSFFQGGKTRYDGVDTGIDGVFDFPLYNAVRQVFTQGKPMRELSVVLAHDRLYPNPNMLVTFLGSHDVARFMSEPGASISGLKLAFTFLLTTRGIPMIYSGDEIAMRGRADPDNRRDFPGGWPGDSHDAFKKSGRTAEEQEIYAHISGLARLRGELEPLRHGALLDLQAGDETYVYVRKDERGAVIVAINNAAKPAAVKCDVAVAGVREGATLVDRLGAVPPVQVLRGAIRTTLPPRSAAIFTAE